MAKEGLPRLFWRVTSSGRKNLASCSVASALKAGCTEWDDPSPVVDSDGAGCWINLPTSPEDNPWPVELAFAIR